MKLRLLTPIFACALINFGFYLSANAASIYVVPGGASSSIGTDTIDPTLPSSIPAGDLLLLKLNLDGITDIQGIEFRLTCQLTANCGVGNVASPVSAFFISDGGVNPSNISLLTNISLPTNPKQSGLFL